jgi:DNA modification methylase
MTSLPIDTIQQGDCLEVMRDWPDGCVDLVLTDPPWELSEHQIEIRGKGVAEHTHKSYTLRKGAVGEVSIEAIRELQRIAAHDCLILAGYKELPAIALACEPLRGIFAWHKPNGTPASFYPAKLDLSFIVWTGRKSLLYGFQHWPSMVFSFSFPNAGCISNRERLTTKTGQVLHPCQGPVALYLMLLRPFPQEAVILDPFCGSGTTCVAAKMLGRHYIGIDISPEYCAIARERLAAVDTGVPVAEARRGQLPLFGKNLSEGA